MEIDFVSKDDRKQYLWVEKYRPSGMLEYLGNESIKESFKNFIEKKDIPHLLLFGPAGTGKTSLAKILVKEIPCDYIYINASDERGIDTVRDKMKSFAMSCGFKPLKIIILDEADYLTSPGQASLRSVMEQYALYTRFLLTCNYPERIIPPIVSRCQSFEIKSPSKKEVALSLVNILKKESVQFTNEDLAGIVNQYYPDIRKVIQFAQQSNMNGVLKVVRSNMMECDFSTKLIEMLKLKKPFAEIRKFIVDSDIRMFEDVYTYLYEKVDVYAPGKEASVILAIADSVYQSSMVVEKQITFVACIINILKNIK